MLADLARSGLTRKDVYAEPSLTDLRGRPLPGYELRYPDPDTGKPNGFTRFRYLSELPPALGHPEKLPKYDQPAGALHAYFSKLIPWPELRVDLSKWLFITEGEKKAAAACKAGYPTIGL